MTPESRAFFEAVTPPAGAESSPETDALYKAIFALHELDASTRARVAALRLKLMRADAAEPDVGVYGKFERFSQVFGAMEREITALSNAARGLTDASFQLDVYGAGVWSDFGEKRPE